jgi:hypothetical protein
LRNNDIRDNISEAFTHGLVCFIKVLVEKGLKCVLTLLVVRAELDPGLDIGSPLSTIIIGNVENTSTRHGGGSRVVKISNLKNKLHVSLDGDTLVRGKSE